MKKVLTLTAAVFLSQLLLLADAQVGKPAPDFSAKDVDGKTHKLSDYKGKILVLESYNFDCPFCANHYKTGAMQDTQEWAKSKGVVWLLVNSASAKSDSYRDAGKARQEIAKNKIKATWIDDSSGEVGKKYGLKTTPHMVVIDKQGKVAYNGAIDDAPVSEGDPRKARNYVKEAIEKVMAGQAVAVANTKPYGCGIKYAN
jgi:peroxiredoxin